MRIKSLLLLLVASLLLPVMAAKEKPAPARKPPSRPPTIQQSMKYQKKHGALAKAKRQKFKIKTPETK